jgi:hypothetical protein
VEPDHWVEERVAQVPQVRRSIGRTTVRQDLARLRATKEALRCPNQKSSEAFAPPRERASEGVVEESLVEESDAAVIGDKHVLRLEELEFDRPTAADGRRHFELLALTHLDSEFVDQR